MLMLNTQDCVNVTKSALKKSNKILKYTGYMWNWFLICNTAVLGFPCVFIKYHWYNASISSFSKNLWFKLNLNPITYLKPSFYLQIALWSWEDQNKLFGKELRGTASVHSKTNLTGIARSWAYLKAKANPTVWHEMFVLAFVAFTY